MNTKYKITETSNTDDEVIVAFDCLLDNEVILSSSITVPHNITVDDVFDRINAITYNATRDYVSVKEYKQKRENKKKEEHDGVVALKSEIDKEIGKEKPIKKPIKKPEKKNERRR